MKTILKVSILTIICLYNYSCGKENTKRTTLPESVNFEFIGKDGKSLINSLKDSVKVSYTENGITKFKNLLTLKLYRRGGDTTTLSGKYNGLVINDGKLMSVSSSLQTNPIRNYTIYLNGVNMGNIYINYWGYGDAYPKPSSENLTFNNIPVQYDRSIETGEYFTNGSDINLLQVQ